MVGDKMMGDKVVRDKVVKDKVVRDKTMGDKVVGDKMMMGDTVGGNKIMMGDKMMGDKVVGDKMVGDKVQGSPNPARHQMRRWKPRHHTRLPEIETQQLSAVGKNTIHTCISCTSYPTISEYLHITVTYVAKSTHQTHSL